MRNLQIQELKKRLPLPQMFQNNIRNIISILLFPILFSIYACKSKIHYSNGIHEERGKNICEEFYVYNNKYNGIFVEYSENKHINKIGTYFDGKRNGLWDTLISNRQAQSQLYYVDDTPQVLMAHKIFLGYYKYLKGDFVFLNIVSWERADSLDEQNKFNSHPSSFTGKKRPDCNIYMINTNKTLLDVLLLQGATNNSEKKELLVAKTTNSNMLNYFEVTPDDTIAHYAKSINTKNGRYEINLSCSKSAVYYYNYIYTTMINAFNPISDANQELTNK